MKNLILLLLLANVVYFGWQKWVVQPTVNDGVHVRTSGDLQPRVEPSKPEVVAAPALPQCYEITGFADEASADEFVGKAEAAGLEARSEATIENVLVGHWVQVLNLPNRTVGRQAVADLQAGGVEETFLANNEDGSYSVSLGLFSELERARTVEAQASAAGQTATIVQRTREEPGYKVVLVAEGDATNTALLTDSDSAVSVACAESEVNAEAE